MAATSKRFMEGPLSKWTNVVNGWQYRWFVLDQTAGLLSYYTSKDKMKRGSRRGCFRLKRSIIGIDDEDDSTFTIGVDNRTYHFQAQDSEEREKWVHALDSCIKRLHKPVRLLDLALPETDSVVGLDQKLAETEGYHQLLQEQIQELSKTINSSEEAKLISQTAKTMLEALQQCIDQMKDCQLTGHTTTTPSPSVSLEASPQHLAPPILQKKAEAASAVASLGQHVVSPATAVAVSSSSSETSESGGETDDSDEFFDAELGEWSQPVGVVMTSPSLSVPLEEGDPSDIEEEQDLVEEDDTAGGVQANKSVIMHMLSQVRVGMDLTRIALPTFILERRSLLEMYAEFFAHPDIFATIPDYTDPKDRIVAITRYYLSAFHAARKGLIAKKPYNPILGEIFECYWDLPNATRKPPDEKSKKLLSSGPVPYASYNSVTFTAEQVSHHPPITGLYAECIAKNMCVSGSVWTRSKFLGLSLGVHFVGTIRLNLLDYGEEYTVTLPNAYGRSILTVPWQELGGKCVIDCQQSGYTSTVDFHCKPFYGGRKHRITAEIHHVSDKKPFLKVEGEWNGVMYSKNTSGEQEVFMDTVNTPTIRKKLRKLSAQDPGESRRRWQRVTEALQQRDIDTATDEKHQLEEKQRAGARERQTTGVDWKEKWFHSIGDMLWTFNAPLDQRLAEVDSSQT